MFKKLFENKIVNFSLFCLFSFVAGGINGFFGTGGGIVFVYMLSILTDNRQKDNYATTLCATIPISLIALFNYWKNEKIDFSLIGRIWIFVLLGGLLSGILVDKLNVKWLNLIFAILVAYSGFRLLIG